MGLIKKIANTVLNYYAEPAPSTIPDIPATANNQQNDFTGTNYNGGWSNLEDLWYQPIKGLGIFDRAGTAHKYKSFAYSAINKRAFAVAKADVFIYKEFKSKKTEIKNHPFLSVLKNKNVYDQTGKEILYLTSVALDLFPDVYWHVIKTQTPIGVIVNEIIFLIPKYVEPILNKANTLIEYYKYGDAKIPKEDVIHFKRPNPYNNLYGYAPADAFNFTLDIEFLQGQTSKAMFGNNANLEGVLLFPTKLNDNNKTRLKSELKGEHGGAGNAGGTLFLDNGADYKRIQATPKEMDYRESRLQIRDEILVILDVPKTVMNITEDVNYSNGENALRSFIENSIQPFAEIVIESKINSYFRNIYGDRFLFKMEWDFKTDRKMQLDTLDLYLRHNLIKKEVLAEQEGYTAEDVPDGADAPDPAKILQPNQPDNASA